MSIDSSFDTPEHFEEVSQKSPETLEREIDQQRSSIGNIVDALEKKMSPGQLVDQALAYVKDNGGEFFGNLGQNVKANPVPAVLTTVGVLWMMMGSNRPASAGYSGNSSVLSSVSDRVGSVAGSVSDGLGSAKARVQETVAHLKDTASKVKDKTSQMTHSMRDTLSGSSDSMQDAGQPLQEQRERIKSGTRHLINEQPLTLAAMGIAVGALIGAALPATTKEKQIIGQAREKLRGKSSPESTSTSTPTSDNYSTLPGAGQDDGGAGTSFASDRPTSPGLG